MKTGALLVLMFVGIVVAVVGILEWMMSFETNDGRGKHTGFRLLTCGVGLVAACAMELRHQ